MRYSIPTTFAEIERLWSMQASSG